MRERERELYQANGVADDWRSRGNGGVRDVRQPFEEEALVRCALDVVAQRYVTEGLVSVSQAKDLCHASPSSARQVSAAERSHAAHSGRVLDLGPQVGHIVSLHVTLSFYKYSVYMHVFYSKSL